jgi:hypothetical protein
VEGYAIEIVLPAANGGKGLEVFFMFEVVCILSGGGEWLGGGVGGVYIIAGFEVALKFDIEDGKAVGEHAAKLNLFF